MSYRQITSEERYTIGTLRRLGLNQAGIARALGRHRSTISREVRRNAAPRDGAYRPELADMWCRVRRSRSRRNQRFDAGEWALVHGLLREEWSPDQISGYLGRHGALRISHETIYRHVWADKRTGGTLYQSLRGAQKQRRKRYGQYDSRGRLAGKRMIAERPPSVAARTTIGHWEGDTIQGQGSRDCLLSLVERKTGYLILGKLPGRTTAELNRRAIPLINRQRRPVRTLTLDNGTEFHGYRALEQATGTRIYFATPHHAWERGTNENTNGLVRQYFPKGQDLSQVTQADCDRIAAKLNRRPRKRLGYRTPEECYGR